MRSLWPRDPSTSILQTLTAWLRRLDVLYVSHVDRKRDRRLGCSRR